MLKRIKSVIELKCRKCLKSWNLYLKDYIVIVWMEYLGLNVKRCYL